MYALARSIKRVFAGSPMTSTAVTAWVGAIAGVAGLSLSIWNALRSQAVWLKVQPQISDDRIPSERRATRFSVRVTNLSTFAVTLERVVLNFGQGDPPNSVDLTDIASDGARLLPMELQPRAAVVMTMDMRSLIAAQFGRFDHAYAITACGKKVRSARLHPFVGKRLTEILKGAPSKWDDSD